MLKKATTNCLFVCLTILFTGSISAQISYSTSFDGCNGTTCGAWSISGGYSPFITSTTGTGYSPCNTAAASSDIYSSATTTTLVATSSLGTSNGWPCAFSFNYKCVDYSSGSATTAGYCTFTVSWAAAAGGPWNTLATFNNVASASCNSPIIPSFLPPSGSAVFIRIIATRNNGDFWAVMDNISLNQSAPSTVGWTGASGTNYQAAGTCGNWSADWCAGSGTYSFLTLTQGINYTIENSGTAACGTALPSAWLQAWWSGGATCGGWGAIGSPAVNSLSFNAEINGDHIVNVTSSSVGANSCGGGAAHDFTGRSAVLHYKQNTGVSNTTSNAAMCDGTTKALTASLTGAHNNPAVGWSIVSGTGSISGTTYTAAGTGSVTIRATVGSCTSDVIFTVNSSANNPGAISVPSTVCAGTSTVISNVTVATTGTPASSGPMYYFYWREVSPATVGWTMYESTTNDHSTLPAIVTNNPGVYYVARNSEFGCAVQNNNATTLDIPITVISGSVAPTSITNSGTTICQGNEVTLTAAGGTLASGASYEWFTGSCGGTSAGTGTSISVSPASTTTYYVRAGAAGGCPATTCTNGTVTLPTPGTALAGTESATCHVSGSNWIHFYSASGKLIVSINPNGNDLGNVTASAYVDGAPILTQACGTTSASFTTATMGRRWVVTPTNNHPASIKLPFADAEFSSMQTAAINTTANALDNVSSISDIKLSKYSGINQNSNWADNCVDGGTLLIPTQVANGAVTTGNGFVNTIASSSFVQFNIPGFSEFWLHNSNNPSALPVELTNFSATCNDQAEVDLNWSTESEQNSQKFIVERSRDMSQWNFVTEHPASGNSNYKIDYTVVDSDPYTGISYYRLVQVDNDGEEKIYGPISVSCADGQNNMIVFPNPTKGAFTVEISSLDKISDAELQVADLTGKVISSRSLNVMEGKNQVLFQGLNLQVGTYIVKLISKDNHIMPVRVVVNN